MITKARMQTYSRELFTNSLDNARIKNNDRDNDLLNNRADRDNDLFNNRADRDSDVPSNKANRDNDVCNNRDDMDSEVPNNRAIRDSDGPNNRADRDSDLPNNRANRDSEVSNNRANRDSDVSNNRANRDCNVPNNRADRDRSLYNHRMFGYPQGRVEDSVRHTINHVPDLPNNGITYPAQRSINKEYNDKCSIVPKTRQHKYLHSMYMNPSKLRNIYRNSANSPANNIEPSKIIIAFSTLMMMASVSPITEELLYKYKQIHTLNTAAREALLTVYTHYKQKENGAEVKGSRNLMAGHI